MNLQSGAELLQEVQSIRYSKGPDPVRRVVHKGCSARLGRLQHFLDPRPGRVNGSCERVKPRGKGCVCGLWPCQPCDRRS